MAERRWVRIVLVASLSACLLSACTAALPSRYPQPLAAVEGLLPASDSKNVLLVGQLGGATQAVALRGDRAYAGVGPRLAILDVSTPTAPVLLGRS
ncbi:MAG TPA: hypothetical protein PLN42_02890, partial [Anaerolineae bacterium]|nr:hypothetical protein [Anaerolineae bacterium]